MARYSIMEAAKLAQQSYKPHTYPALKNRIVDTFDHGDVQASLLSDGTLLIPGSNSLADYKRFNLRVFMVFGKRFTVRDGTTEKGASRTRWHQGFLTHAKSIYDFIGDRRPNFIIGHSLGAASAQILSKTWHVPAIGFASPRPHRGKRKVNQEDLMLNICRSDDVVCAVPSGFRRLGRSVILKPGNPNPGLDHSMQNYIEILEAARGNPKVPTHWV